MEDLSNPIPKKIEIDADNDLQTDEFDPGVELVKIKQKDGIKQDLSIKEKIEIKKEKLRDFKEKLLLQKKGIYRTINQLFDIIEKNPETEFELLMKEVGDNATRYRFTPYQIDNFRNTIIQYCRKHKIVNEYFSKFEDERKLYEECFGRPPKGMVEVKKGAMSLYFRCWELDDFSYIYHFPEHLGSKDVPRLEEQGPLNTNGVSLGFVKIPELNGIVTAENVFTNNPIMEPKALKYVSRVIKKETCPMFTKAQKDLVHIDIIGIASIQIRPLHTDNNTTRLQFIDNDLANNMPFLDIEIEERMNTISIPITHKNQTYATIYIDPNFIQIKDTSPKGTAISYTRCAILLKPNKEASERVRIHEEQHQFNRLFVPLNSKQKLWSRIFDILEKAPDQLTSFVKIIKILINSYKEDLDFNSIPRDEIIAKYKEGLDPEKIIIDMKLRYDYSNNPVIKSWIDEIPSLVKQYIDRYITIVSKQDNKRIELEEEQIKPFVDIAFGKEYQEDLIKWIQAIYDLEKKSYSREEILAILMSEPIKSWPNIARRAKKIR